MWSPVWRAHQAKVDAFEDWSSHIAVTVTVTVTVALSNDRPKSLALNFDAPIQRQAAQHHPRVAPFEERAEHEVGDLCSVVPVNSDCVPELWCGENDATKPLTASSKPHAVGRVEETSDVDQHIIREVNQFTPSQGGHAATE